jgi:serine O-acetyltransferase
MFCIKNDFQFAFDSEFKIGRFLSKLTVNPGFLSVVIYRCQQFLENRSLNRISMAFSSFNLIITGAEICHGAKISVPLSIRHPHGIVIGGNVVIGRNCVVMQGVTIGQRGPDSTFDNGSPIIGDGVRIGAKASILGKVLVGNGTVIGAHSLVLTDTSENSTYVGVPAKKVTRGREADEQ